MRYFRTSIDPFDKVYEYHEDLLQQLKRFFNNKQLSALINKIYITAINPKNDFEYFLASKINKTNHISIADINKDRRIFEDIKVEKLYTARKYHTIEIDCVLRRVDDTMLIEIEEYFPDSKKLIEDLIDLDMLNKHFRKGVSTHLCIFNDMTPKEVEKFKEMIDKRIIITGRELCRRLGLDFDKIIEERRKDQEQNFNYFVDELMKIPEIKKKIFEDDNRKI